MSKPEMTLLSPRGCPNSAWSLPHVPAMTPNGLTLMHSVRDGVAMNVHACAKCGLLYYTSEKFKP